MKQKRIKADALNLDLKLDFLTIRIHENEKWEVFKKIKNNLSGLVSNSQIKIDFNDTDFDLELEKEDIIYKTYLILDKNRNKLAQFMQIIPPYEVFKKNTNLPPNLYDTAISYVLHTTIHPLNKEPYEFKPSDKKYFTPQVMHILNKMNYAYIKSWMYSSSIYTKLTFYWLYFWLYDYDYFDEILDFFSISDDTARPTRFDIKADIKGISPDKLKFKDKYKHRVKLRGEDPTWKLIDMHRYVFRQYDKILDIQDKKLHKLKNNYWEYPYKNIYDYCFDNNITMTRLEFQINSKIIREFDYKLSDILKPEVQEKEFYNHLKSLIDFSNFKNVFKRIKLDWYNKKITDTYVYWKKQEMIKKRLRNIEREITELIELIPLNYEHNINNILDNINSDFRLVNKYDIYKKTIL